MIIKNSNFDIKINKRQSDVLFDLSDVINIFQNELQSSDVIYIPDYIKEDSMLLILDFCDMYYNIIGDIDKPVTEEKLKDYIGSEIYTWILLLNRYQLFELLNSANCLCMDKLVYIICVRIALNIKEMTFDDLSLYFRY